MEQKTAFAAPGLLSVLLASCSLFTAQVAASEGQPMLSPEKRIEVQGHRGARSRLPENTLPGFAYALELGVDVLEMDLAVTKDRQLVLSHDPHLDAAICLGPGGDKLSQPVLIHSLTLQELKTYDCGTLVNPRFPKQSPRPGTRIPTLDEVFDLVEKSPHPNARKVRFNIETKIFPRNPAYTVTPAEFSRLLVEKLKERKMLERSVIQSFDYRTLREARKLEPGVVISALSQSRFENLLKTARELKAQISSPNWKLLNRKRVLELQKNGVRVIPWTANERSEWKRLLDLGVDGIITDDPEALLTYLNEVRHTSRN